MPVSLIDFILSVILLICIKQVSSPLTVLIKLTDLPNLPDVPC